MRRLQPCADADASWRLIRCTSRVCPTAKLQSSCHVVMSMHGKALRRTAGVHSSGSLRAVSIIASVLQ